MSVATTFAGLAAPTGAGDRTFRAVEVSPGIRLAKTSEGRAAILASTGAEARPPIVTRHVRVDFGAACTIEGEVGATTEHVTILECLSQDEPIVRHFLLAVTAVLGDIGSPTAVAVRAAVDALVEAFRAMSKESLTSVQGLWGELFLIHQASDAGALIDAWHVKPQDLHDFGASDQRIEVKTASGRTRRHRFAHDQLAALGVELVVASVMVESAASGATVADLIDRIVARTEVDVERRIRLLGGVTAALGDQWAGAERQRYDVTAASQSLRFFDGDDVPKVRGPLPDHISDLRYAVDLSATTATDHLLLAARGGILRCACPPRTLGHR